MVKQGHYARVSRQKKQRQLKQRHQEHADRVIAPAAVAEFLQVRYHLIRGKQQRPVLRKTMQHFLTQWLAQASASATTWDVTALTTATLQQFNRQLPWQGYALIDTAFADLQAFLQKEVPAVPLATRLQLSDPLTVTAWQRVLTTQLAVNALLGMLGGQLETVTTTQVDQLRAGLLTTTGAVDWVKAASLLGPVTVVPADADAAAHTWLAQLAKLTPKYFD